MAERIYFGTDGKPTFQTAQTLILSQPGPAGEDGGAFVAKPESPQN